MAANDKPAQNGNEAGRQLPADGVGGGDEARIRRQTERIREMERLMRAAAAFARGRPPR